MPKLILQMPGGTEIVNELTEDVITIGRMSDNVIHLDDASVSSHHAEITLVAGSYHLRDLDSTNGTRVNGQRFREGTLHDGDAVIFGKIEGRYASEQGDAAEGKPLPEKEQVAVEVAASSERPTDFANESPFKTKSKKKDPIAAAILVFAGVAVAAFVGAIVSIFMLQPPQ